MKFTMQKFCLLLTLFLANPIYAFDVGVILTKVELYKSENDSAPKTPSLQLNAADLQKTLQFIAIAGATVTLETSKHETASEQGMRLSFVFDAKAQLFDIEIQLSDEDNQTISKLPNNRLGMPMAVSAEIDGTEKILQISTERFDSIDSAYSSISSERERLTEKLAIQVSRCYDGHRQLRSEYFESGEADGYIQLLAYLIGAEDVNRYINIGEGKSPGSVNGLNRTRLQKINRNCGDIDDKFAKLMEVVELK